MSTIMRPFTSWIALMSLTIIKREKQHPFGVYILYSLHEYPSLNNNNNFFLHSLLVILSIKFSLLVVMWHMAVQHVIF